MQIDHSNKLNIDELISPGFLEPGKVDVRYFRLILTISMIRNEKVRSALEDVIVNGIPRKDACKDNNISQSQFSIRYREIQIISQTAVRIHSLLNELE